jgi:hypothetical protein
MNIIKSITLWFSKLSFGIAVGVWIVAATLVAILGTSAPLKSTLEQGRAYEQVVGLALDQARIDGQNSTILLNDSEIKEVAEDVFSPEKLKTYTEDFIDGMYRWLDGEVAEPDFSIELGDSREVLAGAISKKLGSQLSALPTCTTVPTEKVDLLNADCIPAGLDAKTEQSRVASAIASEESGIPSGTFTVDDLKDKNTGEAFADRYDESPEAFQAAKKLPLAVLFIALISCAGVILLSSNRRNGLKFVAKSMIGNGGVVLLSAVLFGLILPAASQKYAYDIANESAPALNGLVFTIIDVLAMTVIRISGAVVGVGALLFVLEKRLPEKHDLGGLHPSQTNIH